MAIGRPFSPGGAAPLLAALRPCTLSLRELVARQSFGSSAGREISPALPRVAGYGVELVSQVVEHTPDSVLDAGKGVPEVWLPRQDQARSEERRVGKEGRC